MLHSPPEASYLGAPCHHGTTWKDESYKRVDWPAAAYSDNRTPCSVTQPVTRMCINSMCLDQLDSKLTTRFASGMSERAD